MSALYFIAEHPTQGFDIAWLDKARYAIMQMRGVLGLQEVFQFSQNLCDAAVSDNFGNLLAAQWC